MSFDPNNILFIFNDPLERLNPLTALKQAIEENGFGIIDVQLKQLDRGQDAEGGSFGRYANFNYKGRFEPIDLKLTNDFRSKFSWEITDKQTEIFSQDVKYSFLKHFRGHDVFGIQRSKLEDVRLLIQPDLEKNYKAQL